MSLSYEIRTFLNSIVDGDVPHRDELVSAIGGVDVLLTHYMESITKGSVTLSTQQIENITRLKRNVSRRPPTTPQEYFREMRCDPYYRELHSDLKEQTISQSHISNLLTYGYIRHCFTTLSISQVMPSALYEIIFNYSKSNAISVVLLGHVDCGKSTMLGRLLFDSGMVPNSAMEEMKNYASQLGKSSFCYAFLCDKLKDERQRGVTIAGSTHAFATESNEFHVYDIPGHRDFHKNAIRFMSMSDVGILVVSAAIGGFEISVAIGDHRRGTLTGTARTHAQLCFSLGIRQLIVCINKLDHTSSIHGTSAMDRYMECKKEVGDILMAIGYELNNIVFIPTSSWNGWNIRQKSSWDWDEGFEFDANTNKRGYTLYDALEYFVKPPVLNERQSNQISGGGVVSIANMFGFYKAKDNAVNDFFTGKVEKGSIRVGQKVAFYPKSKATATIRSIGINNDNDIVYAQYGDFVGIKLDGLTKKIEQNDIMLTVPEAYGREDPLYSLMCKKIKCFNATVFVGKHPGRLYCKNGANCMTRTSCYTPLVCVGTRRAPCLMTKINWKLDIREQKEVKVLDPIFIEAKDKANIELTSPPDQPLIVASIHDFYKYSAINVYVGGIGIVMCGYITHVEYDS
eukprot:610453_1